MDKKTIPVTRPFLPPLEEFEPYLRQIWASARLSNNGPLHQELEQALCRYLGVKHLSLCANGTIGLMLALRALDLSGEVITTPFTFPATAHAITWLGLTPVFADIDPVYFNLEPGKIEEAITERTSAILPVHVYGNLCEVEKIQKLSEKYHLPVVYDACHGFGEKFGGKSILQSGDFSVLSFHPTKVFSTFEGGAVISRTAEMKNRIDLLKNFGIADEENVLLPGINGKMNEVQAAFGLVQLRYMDAGREKRKALTSYYRKCLEGVNGLAMIPEMAGLESNCSYFPVLIDGRVAGIDRDRLYEIMRTEGIHPRKYFHPLVNRTSAYAGQPSAAEDNLPVAADVAGKVLCLPMFADLERTDVDRICNLIKKNL